MAQSSVIVWMIVLAFISAEVSAFAKLIDRPLGEKVGITLNKIPESLHDSEAKTVANELSETQVISVNDELAIVSQLLDRVPLIDGYVMLFNSLSNSCYFTTVMSKVHFLLHF